jgi:hypothetical protein
MRCTQFTGLNHRAKKWLERNCDTDYFEVFKNGKKLKDWKESKKIEGKHKWFGMFDDGGILPGFILPNNAGCIFEKVQCSPWSSGPVIFTFLVNENDEPIGQTKWTEEEMEAYL